ncbi:MAG: ribosome silencing factor [Brevinema sp.]
MTQKLDQLITQITKECERLTLQDIQVYDVKSSLTDIVIVATADHVLQLDAARKQIAFMAKQADYPIQNPTEDHSEGWLAMDFTDLVVHILIKEKRSFYDLDSLMESIINSRMQNDKELSEEDWEEILTQLTPEEAEELLNNLEEVED